MTKFILLSRSRSGSTVLIRSLDKHSQIFCAGEIFNDDGGIYRVEWEFPTINFLKNTIFNIRLIKNIHLNKILNILLGVFRTNSHLKNFYKYAAKNNNRPAGFKLMLSHSLFFPITKLWIKNQNIKKIVLVRENTLAIHISHLKSKKDGYSHLKKGEKVSNQKVFIDTSNLIRRLRKIEKDNNKLKKIAGKSNSLLITYEEIYKWGMLTNKICDFLEVDKESIAPVLKKRSKKELKENISNLDEVKRSLKNTYFYKYL